MMVKNVKIDDETHRFLSMKAAELSLQKGDLCSILVRLALLKATPQEITEAALRYEHERPAP